MLPTPPPLPPPALNGGLYTGQPFAAGAPWRNFPALPDAGFLNRVNLASANPPPGAADQYAASAIRPGNSSQMLQNLHRLPGSIVSLCVAKAPPPLQPPLPPAPAAVSACAPASSLLDGSTWYSPW